MRKIEFNIIEMRTLLNGLSELIKYEENVYVIKGYVQLYEKIDNELSIEKGINK